MSATASGVDQPRPLSVVVLTPDPRDPGGITRAFDLWLQGGLAAHVRVRRIRVAPWDASIGVQLISSARAYLTLLHALGSKRRIDVVHINVSSGASVYREWLFALLARLALVPVVTHVHSGAFGEWAQRRRLRRLVVRDLFARSATVIVTASVWREVVKQLGARDVTVLHHGLTTDLEASLGAVHRGSRETTVSGRVNVVNYGRWTPVKGIDVLAEAIRRLDPRSRARVSLGIWGNGDRGWLEHALRDLEPATVTVGGWLCDVAKPELLANADVFVLPSRTEAFSMTLLEARAAKVPIIASRVGGVPEALSGYPLARLVEPGDAAVLSEALQDLLTGRWPDPAAAVEERLPQRFLAVNVARTLATEYERAADRLRRSGSHSHSWERMSCYGFIRRAVGAWRVGLSR